VEEVLPEHLESVLDFLQEVRPVVKACIPAEKRRSAVFSTLFSACMEAGRPLTLTELAAILEVDP
jgi:hypothetical protein